MKLGKLGEFGLIERIRKQVVDAADVCRGIGDDAAELQLPPGHHLLTSTDMLIEGVHFRLDWTDAKSLGHKAVAVNLSDLAAMGATPRFLYLGLACPADAEIPFIEAFLEGVLAETAAHQVVLVGGDTCRSSGPWVMSVTVEGSAPAGTSVGRWGARPGDLVMVSGTLGDSALALDRLTRAQTLDEFLLQRHLCPTPRVAFGQALADKRLATAMIDISDGLSSDLEHILQASRVDAVLDLERLPLSESFKAQLAENSSLLEMALHGGEDYELLFTVAAEAGTEAIALAEGLGLPATVIGLIEEGSGHLRLRDAEGEVRPMLVRGYDHFCRPGEDEVS